MVKGENLNKKTYLATTTGYQIPIAAIVIFIAIISIPVLFILGSVWLSTKVIPWLNLASEITFFVILILLLPLSIFPKTRSFAGSGMIFLSFIFGLNLWFLGLLLTYALWGAIAVIIGLFIIGIGVVPIAMLATLFNGMWKELGILFLLTFLTFGVRFLGFYLIEKAEEYNMAQETQAELYAIQNQDNKKLSVGIYIASIIFIILGGLWVISFLLNPNYKMSGYFIWGIPLLIGGVGMLKRKYWALRLTQIYFILSALQVFIIIPFILFTAEKIDLFAFLIVFFLLLIFIGLPIWFLFKKSIVNQFKRG